MSLRVGIRVFLKKCACEKDPSNMLLDFARVLKQAGLMKIRFHDLRQTLVGVVCLKQNVNVKDILSQSEGELG
jgi:hypothetical protein